MPNAITAIFGADSTPMSAEFAKQEQIAQRFGRTIHDINVQENAQMLSNAASLREKIRLQDYLKNNTGGLKTVVDLNRAENEELIRKSKLLRDQIALRQQVKTANVDLIGYQDRLQQMAQPFGGNMRAMNASDNDAWVKKLAAMKVSKGLMTEAQASSWVMSKTVAATAGTTAATSFMGGFLAKMSHGSGPAQLIHVFRATFDSIVSGMSPWRVFLQQGPQALQAITQMGSGFLKVLATISVAAIAVGAIIAAPFIYLHRIASQVKDMVGPMRDVFATDHIAKYLQKANELVELQKDLTEEVRKTREEHDSVVSVLDAELALTKDRIGFEKELLELQKANELAGAKTPEERERIEKKYSGLILSKKKEERDAELQHMRDVTAQLPKEMQTAQDEIAAITAQNDYMSSESDKAHLEDRKKNDERWEKYRAQLMPGEKDKRDFSLEKDRATIDRLTGLEGKRGDFSHRTYHLSDSEKQELANAKQRVADSQSSLTSLQEFQDSEGDRERQRARVKELEDKIKADQKKLESLTEPENGDIARTAKANLQRDQEDLALEKERLNRTDRPGKSGERGFGLNSQQRLGAYASTPPDWSVLLLNVKGIHENTKHLQPNPNAPPGSRPPQFGPRAHK